MRQRPDKANHKTPYPKIIGGEGTGGWRLRPGSLKGSPPGDLTGDQQSLTERKGCERKVDPPAPADRRIGLPAQPE